MSPKDRRRRTRSQQDAVESVRTGPSSDDPHRPVYYVRDDGTIPDKDVLDQAPRKVAATMKAVIAAVAEAPPKRFAGGGYWEAMHGDMTGWFEIRVDGPGRRAHLRLFCLLDYQAEEQDRPLLVIVTGLSKAVGTRLSQDDYATVQVLGQEYLARNPRSIA